MSSLLCTGFGLPSGSVISRPGSTLESIAGSANEGHAHILWPMVINLLMRLIGVSWNAHLVG